MIRESTETFARRAIDAGAGVLRLAPNWVPRTFLEPGGRLGLHRDDLFALGRERGGIDERWLASTVAADNPGAPPNEGLSQVVFDGRQVSLREAIAAAGPEIVGRALWDRFQGWPVFAKFFDNLGPIPLHLHPDGERAKLVGRAGKPEAYYFPPEMNAIHHRCPRTRFGLEPGTTRDDVRRCLDPWGARDYDIAALSPEYLLVPGTGWSVPPGILHAPGSLVTFEPQWASDVFAIFQSEIEGRPISRDLLVKDVPADRRDDLEWIIDLLDWPANVDPHFVRHHYLPPIADPVAAGPGVTDRWVVYGRMRGQQLFTVKELTLAPGASTRLQDGGASGLTVMRGRGRIGGLPAERRTPIRFGELTTDEFFLTEPAARAGVLVENLSDSDPFVTLRYLGPDASPGAPEIPS